MRDYGTASWDGGDPECDHQPPAWTSDSGDASLGEGNVLTANMAKWHARTGGECPRCGAVRAEQTVWGGDPACAHAWGEPVTGRVTGGGDRPPDNKWTSVGRHQVQGATSQRRGRSNVDEQRSDDLRKAFDSQTPRLTCTLCGAWRGQLGLEPTPEAYVEHMVEVMREVKRVLRRDGTLWLNLGDSYVSHDPGGYREGEFLNPGGRPPAKGQARNRAGNYRPPGLKPKDLVGIPWMVAFALRADGWWLRTDVIWNKPNAMPESVEDRPTRAHEYLFLLTKSARYFYDFVAIREPVSESMLAAIARGPRAVPQAGYQHDDHNRFGKTSGNRAFSDESSLARIGETGRNKRDVWTVPTDPYPGAHFAVFPPRLIEPAILAGTSAKGVCPECGAPWVRVLERAKNDERDMEAQRAYYAERTGRTDGAVAGPGGMVDEVRAVGWKAGCAHTRRVLAVPYQPGSTPEEYGDDEWRDVPLDPVPATVLDPFGGSGTTAMVANLHGRDAIIVELNESYVPLIEGRLVPKPREGRSLVGDAPLSLWEPEVVLP